ncbi:hypothetical protein DWU98_12610 [Dyella monticola]|uniref:Uncharacterized protein n=1 Tax=Dyella monticola TaxID=1927958 RepID=A0A370WXB0_9GAMM|nr:hypothetical protein [Dyella monticola]RDS80793.1 hypothetical protein DWU98_12610 [Dyella monticola]
MSKGHEPHQVEAAAVYKLGTLFVVLLTFILWLMYVLWEHVHPWTLTLPAEVIPPQPRLQVSAPEDRATQYRLQAQQLESYGWVDSDHRAAHIPIERAMTLLTSPQHAGHPRSGSP